MMIRGIAAPPAAPATAAMTGMLLTTFDGVAGA